MIGYSFYILIARFVLINLYFTVLKLYMEDYLPTFSLLPTRGSLNLTVNNPVWLSYPIKTGTVYPWWLSGSLPSFDGILLLIFPIVCAVLCFCVVVCLCSVSCAKCCLCLWIVDSWFPRPFCLTVIKGRRQFDSVYNMEEKVLDQWCWLWLR